MKELEVTQKKKVHLRHFLKKSQPDNRNFSHLQELESSMAAGRNSVRYIGKVNDLRHIHTFFREVNSKLITGTYFRGAFLDCDTKYDQKRPSIAGKFMRIVDFLLHRVIPKTRPVAFVYYAVTKGRNRRLSKAEVLGRLVAAGFEIVRVQHIGKLTHFCVRKISEPMAITNVSKGWLYRMPRVGLNGKIIYVYKVRTMHPYSEFLQDYLKKQNGYGDNGKIRDDFRMTSWGRLLRRYWIDEIPQVLNLLKGDLKLVGVRPISRSYFNDIPEDLKQLRVRQKPGCIPPYVAMNRAGNVASVLQAEKEYLEVSIKRPLHTDMKYFCLAVYNIIIKRKRSA